MPPGAGGDAAARAAAAQGLRTLREVERISNALRTSNYDGPPVTPLELLARVERALAELHSPGYAGPTVHPEAAAFARVELLRHVRRVIGMLDEMDEPVRLHDIDEAASLESVLQLLRSQRAQGIPAAETEWLGMAFRRALEAGDESVDVSKLRPEVIAGLGRRGRPEQTAYKTHQLSEHHRGTAPTTAEAQADMVEAMRAPRSYKPEMSWAEMRRIFQEKADEGVYTPEIMAGLERAIRALQRIEGPR